MKTWDKADKALSSLKREVSTSREVEFQEVPH